MGDIVGALDGTSLGHEVGTGGVGVDVGMAVGTPEGRDDGV